jgi:predicted metallopeptidase
MRSSGLINENMNREEVSKRFNALPVEHRVTIISNELEQEIRWLEREKRDAIKAHAKNLERYNERIKALTKSLHNLKDD